MLNIFNLHAKVGDREILRGITLKIKPGDDMASQLERRSADVTRVRDPIRGTRSVVEGDDEQHAHRGAEDGHEGHEPCVLRSRGHTVAIVFYKVRATLGQRSSRCHLHRCMNRIDDTPIPALKYTTA